MPALGMSLFLMAIGAILAFAVDIEIPGLSIETIGVILMVIGVIGVLFALLSWTSYSPWGAGREERIRRTRVVDDYAPRDVVDRTRVTRTEPYREDIVERTRVVDPYPDEVVERSHTVERRRDLP